MNITDILIAKKLAGGGGGGGGSSDFSTAEVTIVYSGTTTEDSIELNGNVLDSNRGVIAGITLNDGTNSFTIVLYKNKPVLIYDYDELIISTEGDVEKIIVEGDIVYEIHGDCTITIPEFQLI